MLRRKKAGQIPHELEQQEDLRFNRSKNESKRRAMTWGKTGRTSLKRLETKKGLAITPNPLKNQVGTGQRIVDAEAIDR